MEQLLMKLLQGQERTEKRLDKIQGDLSNVKNDLSNVIVDLAHVKEDVTNIKEAVNRIENHQEETIMGILSHIKKQVDTKESQIQVLNKRLFTVETKTEQTQQ
jgi:septation ring formation regulator EzrA